MHTTRKSPTGDVGIESKQGKLRIRLPRAIAKDSQRYINTRLDDTSENLKKVQRVAWDIEEDIRCGNLDSTLEKYRISFKPRLTIVKTTPNIDLGALWVMYSEYRKPQVAKTTFARAYVSQYPNKIANLPSRDISRSTEIRDFILVNYTPDSARRFLVQLSACCKWAKRSGLVQENPFLGMAQEIKVVKKDTSTIDPFSTKERDAILKSFQEHPTHKHYYPFVRFLFLTGCRTGEAIALQWKHISKDCKQINFCESYDSCLRIRKDTKTHKPRKFPCNPMVQDFLLSIRPENYQMDDLLFTSKTGKPIDNISFTNRVWRGCSNSGRLYEGIVTSLVEQGLVSHYRTLYSTRHTFISLALEAGLTVSQVAKIVGNTPEVILNHYATSLLRIEIPVF